MVSKKSLLGGQQIKVENLSGFDKSRYNAFTAPLGAIVPMVKQLMIPGSFKLRINLSSQLPPLAADAFLRTHLKVEAFLVPLRICYGGFQSFYAGEKILTSGAVRPGLDPLGVAKLPRLKVIGKYTDSDNVTHAFNSSLFNRTFGPHTLMDYFGVKYPLINGSCVAPSWADPQISGDKNYSLFNIFPFIAYQLCYDHWYRNKLIERPLFVPVSGTAYVEGACTFPTHSYKDITNYFVHLSDDYNIQSSVGTFKRAYDDCGLCNGHLLELRQRNYGFDYFTSALPSAQDGQPMSVDTSGGSFTISALRIANTAQHFSEINLLAGPDYLSVNKARYGIGPSAQIAQRPILLGSADFPMFTSRVEQNMAGNTEDSYEGVNPFTKLGYLGSAGGRAHAEGQDFICEANVTEPSYLMVMCSLVPEANYAIGIDHDMRRFTQEGSLVDIPVASLERAGMEPILSEEIGLDDSAGSSQHVFGYQMRYVHHKAGQVNEVHGLFRQGASLEAFIPQRLTANNTYFNEINSAFLKVQPTDLDNVTAVSGLLSEYGVMVDSHIELHVVEPLAESPLPSLADPAYEHGREVYLKRGGVSVND